MAEFQYVITDGAGLHARPAAQLARLVKETDCAVTVGKEGQTADAAGVMSLMRLGIKKGDEVTVTADDPKVLEVLRESGESGFMKKKNARLKKERLVTRLRNGNGMRMPETQHEIN